VIATRWRERWPGGLLIPTADIPDRDPFVDESVAGRLDPTVPRAPRAHWTEPSSIVLDGLVDRLAEFLSNEDVKRLDSFLYRRAIEGRAPRREHHATCTLETHAERQVRLVVSCARIASAPEGFELEGWLKIDAHRKASGRLHYIGIDGRTETVGVRLSGNAIALDPRAGRFDLSLVQDGLVLSPRRIDGDLIERLRMTWTGADAGTGRVTATGTLSVLEDYSLLPVAIEEMVWDALGQASDVLGARPFRRRAVLQALYSKLGLTPLAAASSVSAHPAQ
jgi:hypothetical protein